MTLHSRRYDVWKQEEGIDEAVFPGVGPAAVAVRTAQAQEGVSSVEARRAASAVRFWAGHFGEQAMAQHRLALRARRCSRRFSEPGQAAFLAWEEISSEASVKFAVLAAHYGRQALQISVTPQ